MIPKIKYGVIARFIGKDLQDMDTTCDDLCWEAMGEKSRAQSVLAQ
jgi:hypothetical protein